MDKNYSAIADAMTKRINRLEEKLAKKYYGCKFSDLCEDDRNEITMDVYDIINGND